MSERAFGPCPKCGGTDINVQFHDGVRHCEQCRRGRIDPPSCRYSGESCKPWYDLEHLRVHCRRCQFQWVEATAVLAIIDEAGT